jgi:hypothetical protein
LIHQNGCRQAKEASIVTLPLSVWLPETGKDFWLYAQIQE